MQDVTAPTSNILTQYAAPPACTLVIFGGGGDLTKRLLVPSLYDLAESQTLPQTFSLIGVDRTAMESGTWRDGLRQMIESFTQDPDAEFSATSIDDAAWGRLFANARYIAGDFTQPALFETLRDALGDGNAIFYLAVPARFFGGIVTRLGEAGLLAEQEGGAFRRVVIEKPFGHDLASARELDATLLHQGREAQFYRIDHFLGKETVQSIMALRFANGMFEPVWRQEYIDHIQITAAETVGVEQRGAFYEVTGALRDMVPNHLFTILCMIAMEPPNILTPEAVREEKAKLLQAIRVLAPEDYVRGQYTAGSINGADVPGYREEPNVSPDSTTETYAAMKLHVDNWRWGGVPFYLRTGKRMQARQTEIAIFFKQAPHRLFANAPSHGLTNIVRLLIDPVHGIQMHFDVKKPGPGIDLASVYNSFRYDDFFPKTANVGYETLLYDCMAGDPMLFQRSDAIEEAWRIVDDVLKQEKSQPEPYAAGTLGPKDADDLLARDGRAWLPVGDQRRRTAEA
ncbi:glucose-6-phosphate 1-dehydrogenase [Neoasaia chiangmaiensis]|uniref:Glucose-6-phosphate 1-dehydrogenase n=2 Tax=Neoasaia chiangmaiensis TaxID=320497 RepID=A0A1U9KUQ2_9PROT|nr:glucose-6-phosphate dehydrogenase [Neoasaia chiangmaiensis]AQS89525.1 glucose-6-phosphate dehydrogenase [Neoasaia chiangmaiensis]GEN13599.1 glucose-6-phosphate 1-dehydrogenase [Neoasaia chiangmaiensis]